MTPPARLVNVPLVMLRVAFQLESWLVSSMLPLFAKPVATVNVEFAEPVRPTIRMRAPGGRANGLLMAELPQFSMVPAS